VKQLAALAYRKLAKGAGDLPLMDHTTHNSIGSPSRNIRIIRSTRGAVLRLAQILLLATSVITAAAATRFVPGQLLVKPRGGLAETNFSAKLRSHDASSRGTLHGSNVRAVAVPEEKAEATLTALRNDPDIEFAERDYIAEAAYVPSDPYVLSGSEWHLAQIQTPQAWNFTVGLSNIVVAVLDSGVNAAHPDLATRILPGYDFVFNDPDPADDFGHGTAVCGTIVAAGNNDAGVAGVAFGCRVLPVKVMDAAGVAYYSAIAQGIHYAVDAGARIINLSIAGSSPSSTLQDAIDYAWDHNVVVVAAAGNNADNVPQYPAACEHVIAVSATEPGDTLASFSSFGNDIALSAPGDTIWTTQRDPANPYGAWRGTSFASPIVAGVAALVLSANPLLSSTQIVSVLEQSADDAGAPGWDALFGYGRVNAASAVGLAMTLPGALPPQPPPPANTNAPVAVFAKGRYAGLVINTNEVTPGSSGCFTLATTAAGTFTGKMLIGGTHLGFRGRFDSNGVASVTVKRGKNIPLTLVLHADFTEGTDSVTGSVTDGGWSSELIGDRNVFNAKNNPAPQAGLRGFVLQAAENALVTAATGSSSISTAGAAKVKGRLNDGRAFSVGSLLAKNGDCPFYLSFNHGSEAVIGWLNFPAAPAASGTVLWVRSGTNAFVATLTAASAP
jgi:subtilisin family serine protease